VTEQIRALEHAVGRALFVWQNNRLELTAAGEALVVRANSWLWQGGRGSNKKSLSRSTA
jgi:DNA-binding transcriptional LysR family regulator